MLLYRMYAAGACCVLLVMSAGIVFAGARSDRAVRITASLNKPEITIGEEVTLKEVISVHGDVQVSGIDHDVIQIGYYDRKLGALVNCPPSLFVREFSDRLFEKLPSRTVFSHPLAFDIRTPKHKGTAYTFRPNRVGIFLITATWRQRGGKPTISSNPVVLVVTVPLKGAIKPQWLGDELPPLKPALDGGTNKD